MMHFKYVAGSNSISGVLFLNDVAICSSPCATYLMILKGNRIVHTQCKDSERIQVANRGPQLRFALGPLMDTSGPGWLVSKINVIITVAWGKYMFSL